MGNKPVVAPLTVLYAIYRHGHTSCLASFHVHSYCVTFDLHKKSCEPGELDNFSDVKGRESVLALSITIRDGHIVPTN